MAAICTTCSPQDAQRTDYFIFTFSLNKINLIRAAEYELIHLCSLHLTLSCAETAGYEPFPFF